MKKLIRFIMALPLLSLLGYLVFLGVTQQWLYFGMVWIAIFIIVILIFHHDPWDRS